MNNNRVEQFFKEKKSEETQADSSQLQRSEAAGDFKSGIAISDIVAGRLHVTPLTSR